MKVIETLTAIFRDLFEDETLVLTPEMSAQDVEEWDSLTHIQLLAEVQNAFSISLTTSEILSLKTVGDLIALIQAKADYEH